jgi:hypothetical protein
LGVPAGYADGAPSAWCWSNSPSVQCRPTCIHRTYCIFLVSSVPSHPWLKETVDFPQWEASCLKMLRQDSILLMQWKIAWYKAGKWCSLAYCWAGQHFHLDWEPVNLPISVVVRPETIPQKLQLM